MTRNVTFLFGAGASVDAGLPISVKLTQEIAAHLDQSGLARRSRTGVALNAAIGALVAYDSARGESAYAGVDVERLFSAAQMLANRDDLEVSPFVGNWNESVISGTEPRMPPGWGRDLQRALGLGDAVFNRNPRFDVNRTERLVKEAIVRVNGSADSGSIYASLQIAMMQALKSCLTIAEGSDLSYLTPAFSLGEPVRIATLNYDQTVERSASQAGVSLSTGAKHWRGGFNWQWPDDADVHLLKLHGSINWRIIDHGRLDRSDSPLQEELSGPAVVEEDESLAQVEQPGIIFGQRGKLRADGPFLAMLKEFGNWLTGTDELVIVGYSFRDAHINVAVRDWYFANPAGRIWIIDPAFPGGPEYGTNRWDDDFRAELSRVAYRCADEPSDQGGGVSMHDGQRVAQTERFRIFRSGAAAALPVVAAELSATALDLN